MNTPIGLHIIMLLVVRMLIFWYTRQELSLGGELKCRHVFLFLMEYVREECYLHLYLLYTWMILIVKCK